jgi:Flp pilus assembly protein TadD
VKKKYKIFIFRSLKLAFLLLIFLSCNPSVTEKKEVSPVQVSPWLNHSDTAKYVGKETCRLCHQSIYESFLETGMGRSIGVASKNKSSADFHHPEIYDEFSNLHYKAKWSNDSLYISEFRLKGNDTVHNRTENIQYIIGSGQHTNSHLISTNGYVQQAPMTYFTQKHKWDLPPGFENGKNSRFNRIIGLECMSCHNAFPEFVQGSENKFISVPNGIDCERCHGPGSIHVQKKTNREIVDTAKEIDYSIVNPAKLPIEKQFDICMRCHLQGNAVLNSEKSWFDYKPGMNLSDYISVFLPRYENSETEFIMASHADRLKQSKCFIQSAKSISGNKNQLRPYKNALTCVTCHNPHISVKHTSINHFNQVCSSCHNGEKLKFCSEKSEITNKNKNNCVSCHMPQSGSTDIPHVSIHDHYIRKKISKTEISKLKKFIGLQSINNSKPDSITIAKAYVNQYEKFDPNLFFLDSAEKYLGKKTTANTFVTQVQIYFNQKKFKEIETIISKTGIDSILRKIIPTPSINNENAWCAYRLGEACLQLNKLNLSLKLFEHAVHLAPYIPDFRLKLGIVFLQNNQRSQARKIFTASIIEFPKDAKVWTNLGYLDGLEGDLMTAEKNYKKALELNPDHVSALINFGGLKVIQQKYEEGAELLTEALKIEKTNQQAQTMLYQLSQNLMRTKNTSLARNIISRYLKTDDKSIFALQLKKILE